MTVVKSRIRMQNFSTKQLFASVDFLQSQGKTQPHSAKLKNCQVDKAGLTASGKFVLQEEEMVTSVCSVDGKKYLTDGVNVYALNSDGTRKTLLTTSGFQGENARLFGDSLRQKIVFNAIHGVFFTNGTSGNTNSKLFAYQMDCISFVEQRVVGALGNTLYVSDSNAVTLTPGSDVFTSAITFSIGSQVTALCGVNNTLYVFADGDMYKVDVTNAFDEYKFEKVAKNIGFVRYATYFKNKMYCFCDDGIKIVDGTVKDVDLVAKPHFAATCRPVVWKDKLVFADDNDVVMYGSDGSVQVVAQKVVELSVMDDELYAVYDKKLYKYEQANLASDNCWTSSVFDFGEKQTKNLRSVALCGSGNATLRVTCDGFDCCAASVNLTSGKPLQLSCFGTGKNFVAKLTLTDNAVVESVTFCAVQY